MSIDNFFRKCLNAFMPAGSETRRRHLPTTKAAEFVTTQLSTPEAPQFFPTVACASKSKRKARVLGIGFPNSQIVIMGGGDEDQSKSATQIAKDKVSCAFVRVSEDLHQNKPKMKEPILVIAGDVRTTVFGMSDDGSHTEAKCFPKPKRLEDIRKVFEEMYQAHELTGTAPYYDLSIGTDIDIYNRIKAYYIAGHTTHIQLDPEKIRDFSTEEGFAKYCQAAEEVFTHPTYMANGDEPSLSGVAGGLDLITLLRLGAVTKIVLDRKRECNAGDKDFPKFAKIAIYDALIGILQKVLKKYSPNIKSLIDGWKELNDLTDFASERIIFQA